MTEESKRRMPYRSLSYRFDCPGRSIVFSGDTAYSAGLVKLARGADVFICEAIEVTSMRQAFERMFAGLADLPSVSIETTSLSIYRSILTTSDRLTLMSRLAAQSNESAALP